MGPAPVPLHEYNIAVRRQSLPENFATHDLLRRALGELVVSEETLELLGPAFNSRSSVFLYGHPGNGKSSIARDRVLEAIPAMLAEVQRNLLARARRYRDERTTFAGDRETLVAA